MRKVLLGTTALVAAGLMAGTAQAADMIGLSLSGYFSAGLAVTNQDLDEGKRNHVFNREGEIYFRGSTTLDGDVLQTVGVNVELEAESLGDQIDETYLYFGGPFGQIRLGQDDGAMQAMGVYPAGVSASVGGIVFCTFSEVGGADGGCNVGEGAFGLGPDYDAEKIGWLLASRRRCHGRHFLHSGSQGGGEEAVRRR